MDKIAMLLFFLLLAGVFVLDMILLVSILKPKDERRQLIVWKASAAAFAGTVGSLIIRIVRNMLVGYEGVNPFTFLASIATLYAIALLYYKRKHGDWL